MHQLPWITIFWSRVKWFANNFHEWWSHEWKSLANHLTSSSRMKIIGKSPHEWPKNRIHGNECIILFLTRYFVLNTPFRNKHSSIYHFAIVAMDGLSWLNIVTSSQLICDVMRTRGTGIGTGITFVDCSCTRKLAQRRSSLVNNNREYRFLTTRYSRLSV